MKILTKEEEAAHYKATVRGGTVGGLVGLGLGVAVVYGAHLRFHTIRNLTLPVKAFLVTSSATFSSIISADRASRSFENARDPSRKYKDKASTDEAAARSKESTLAKLKDWGRENRYPIVTASWVASMGIALGLVGRNPYLTKSQKLVQARVYAQGLTLAVLLATAMLEVGDANTGRGRWETVKIVDPNDPAHMIEKRIHHESYAGEDQWRDMVASEERKLKAMEEEEKADEEQAKKTKNKTKKNGSKDDDKASKK